MNLSQILRAFVQAASLAAALLSRADDVSAQCDFPHLLDATLSELRAGLDSGTFTSVDLVNAYIARINEVNGELRAVLQINPDALSIAAELDDQRRVGQGRLPLHGIPVLVKDNIATADRLDNTAGSLALVGAKVPEDSTVVAKLRKAGAIILGKSNLSEWAGCRSANSSQGWSAVGGQTVGAYFARQDPSGSSSGSAVASSLGLSWASLGTETAGSINHPSHLNNIVGIKPTVGLTSRYLVVPVTEHQDTVGPMARTVEDAAYLLSAIVGRDSHDNYTLAIPFEKVPDYVGACKKSGLKGKRLGVSRNLMSWVPDPTADLLPEAFEEALDVLRDAGVEIIDDIFLPGVEILQENLGPAFTVAAGDFLANLANDYLGRLESNPRNITSLTHLVNFTQEDPDEAWPARDTKIWEQFLELDVDNTSPSFWHNYSTLLHWAGHLGLTGALRNHSLDALVAPGPHAYQLSSALGTPTVTVPMGRMPEGSPVQKNVFGNLNRTAPNQPIGIGFAGEAFSEEVLIGIACAFEQRTMVRKSITPYIQPKTELADVVKGGGECKGGQRREASL